MTEPLTLDLLVAKPDGSGVNRIWDNRDPARPQPLDETELVKLVARLLLWHSMLNEIGEDDP